MEGEFKINSLSSGERQADTVFALPIDRARVAEAELNSRLC